MNDRDQRALDWVQVYCEQEASGNWRWQSGYLHNEESSVKIARTCQSLGIRPSDIVSIELMDVLVNRLLSLEEKLTEVLSLGEQLNGAMVSDGKHRTGI